jgi:hypothetical protein
MGGGDWTAGLWLAVLASGVYHGLSPGMGWPLAVSAGLSARRTGAVVAAMGPIALGHFAATALVLLPFAALSALVAWRQEVQVGAGLMVAGFGVWRLARPRHPRLLARIPPARLALWSFAIALAHGAGLLALPAALGLCAAGAEGAMAAAGTATAVAAVHAGAMTLAAGAAAVAVYRWLGLGAIARSWWNLDRVWAASLVLAGGAGLAAAV